ncbi:MAG: peptidoglycan editing factor PgeF [Pseudomonadota bacterium]
MAALVFPIEADLPASLGACMSTRAGGGSPAPYDSLNLGDHVGDAPAHVQANRETLARALGARPVFLQQVHGTAVCELRPDTPDGVVADACFTRAPGLACTIMVADCLPVLLWDVHGRWVAAAHAGWRGLAGGVLEALWAALQAQGAEPADARGWLGPCIGPGQFEVGPEVRAAFVQQEAAWQSAFIPGRDDRFWADLPALARVRLQRLGLAQIAGNDGSAAYCTVSQPALFFSHRRDAGGGRSTGRMAACIWRRGV